MSEVTHITEIAPANMPDWAAQAIDKGKFFNIAVAKIKALELKLESADDVFAFYGNADHYAKFFSERITPIRADRGKRARKWLDDNG